MAPCQKGRASKRNLLPRVSNELVKSSRQDSTNVSRLQEEQESTRRKLRQMQNFVDKVDHTCNTVCRSSPDFAPFACCAVAKNFGSRSKWTSAHTFCMPSMANIVRRDSGPTSPQPGSKTFFARQGGSAACVCMAQPISLFWPEICRKPLAVRVLTASNSLRKMHGEGCAKVLWYRAGLVGFPLGNCRLAFQRHHNRFPAKDAAERNRKDCHRELQSMISAGHGI